MRSLVVIALIGCGRIGFSPGGDGDGGTMGNNDGLLTDGTMVDLPGNAMTVTFGEIGTATFQNVTADTFISNEAGEPTLNYGTTDELRSEQDVNERILLRFDLTMIPSSATVTSATLTVTVSQANASATWELHPVLELWPEGSQDGAAGSPNYTDASRAEDA